MRFIQALFFLTVVFSDAHASDKIIRITASDYPPFTGQDLENFGVLCEVVKQAFAHEKVKVEYSFFPDARALKLAELGRYDASLVWAKRESRLSHFYYGEPVMESDKEFFFHKKTLNFEWDAKKQDYAQLKNYRIAAIIGFNYGKEFQTAEKNKIIQVSRLKSTGQAIKMIDHGRIDLFITPRLTGLHTLKKDFPKMATILGETLAIDRPVTYDYLVVSKKSPKAKFFLQAMNRGLIWLKKSGQYQKIMHLQYQVVYHFKSLWHVEQGHLAQISLAHIAAHRFLQ